MRAEKDDSVRLRRPRRRREFVEVNAIRREDAACLRSVGLYDGEITRRSHRYAVESAPNRQFLAAKLLEASVADLILAEGFVKIAGTDKQLSLGEIAHVWYRKPQLLPADVDSAGLEATAGYKAKVDTGTFSYACHATKVAVDIETGAVEILDYVIVEDGGVLVNPMIVDGQVFGGTAQGVGTALYEEMPFDAQGQPLATTLADYLLPSATEVPSIRIDHMETPSPHTRFGQKGIGEGGAIAPPAAIANAVNDALAPLGVEINESPLTPRRIVEALLKK